ADCRFWRRDRRRLAVRSGLLMRRMLPTQPASGEARLHVASVAGRSVVVGSWARSPLHLLTPRSRGGSVWAYTCSFGGGLVAGDRTRLELCMDAGARCF